MRVKLHKGQSEIFRALFIRELCRHAVAVCSRGWGKSYFATVAAITAIHELLDMPTWVPNKNVYIIGPTFDQVIDIYYPIIAYDFGYLENTLSSSKGRGRFKFRDDVELRLVSYEAIERLRGKGAYFVVNDEVSSWEKGIGFQSAWDDIIEPCITTRWSPMRAAQFGVNTCGRSLTISTPKGYNFLYDMFNFHHEDSIWKSFHFDYHSSPLLDPNEIARIQERVDPLTFAREYLASFKESGANVFYCFDREQHVNKEIGYFEDYEDVHVNIDFNVGLQCSSMFALRGGKIEYIEESQGLPNTEELALYLKNKYEGHNIIAYPDPTGNSKKTSAPVGQTDFSILRSHGIKICARSKSPPIVDSVAAVNSKLYSVKKNVMMQFHPRCKGTIKSMERTKWLENNPNLAIIDKSEGIEHFSDGVRYSSEYLFPVIAGGKRVSRQTTRF